MVFQYEFNDVGQAIAFEKQVKGWSRRKKEAIIKDDWSLLPELSLNKEKRLRQAQPDNGDENN